MVTIIYHVKVVGNFRNFFVIAIHAFVAFINTLITTSVPQEYPRDIVFKERHRGTEAMEIVRNINSALVSSISTVKH